MIHGSSKSLQNIGVGLLKDPTLMGTFALPPPNNLVEVTMVGTCNMIASRFRRFLNILTTWIITILEILYQSIFLAWGANPNQCSSSVWIDRSKEYGISSDPWSHIHSTNEGIIQSMMIGEAPWENYHHCSHLPDYHENYSSNLNHPSVFDFLSNTVNTWIMRIVLLLSQPH